MRDNEWIDYSIVYSQRHKKFYRWVIYPIIFLFLVISFFLIFAKTEVVVRTAAILTPRETISIQVPIATSLKENYIEENTYVKEGDILAVFDTESLMTEKVFLELENEKLLDHKDSAELFIDSLLSEKNEFLEEDSYGYYNLLNSFIAEKQISKFNEAQISETSSAEKEAHQKMMHTLDDQLVKLKNKQDELNKLRHAWINKKELTGISTELTTKHKLWLEQIKNTPEEQKEQERITISTQIDELISSTNRELEQLDEQKATLSLPISSENQLMIQKENITRIKHEFIAQTKQDLISIKDQIDENNKLLDDLSNQIRSATVTAPINGTMHVIEELNTSNTSPIGAVLAEIYPVSINNSPTFTAQVSASEMTHVEKGLDVNFKLDKKGISPKVIKGKLTEISEMSIVEEGRVYYTVKGELQTEEEPFRHGLTGELSMILGKKTYWQIIKDILLNRS